MWKVQVRVAVVAVVAVLMCARVAAAEEVAPETKGRGTAFALSAGGTAISIGLVVAGVSNREGFLTGVGLVSSLVTPTTGEIYAGKVFTAGMGIRLASVGVGFIAASALATCTYPLVAAGGCRNAEGGAALLVLAGLGYAGGIVYDIAAAGSAVDDYNQRLRLRVAPTVIPTAASGPAVGVGITGSF